MLFVIYALIEFSNSESVKDIKNVIEFQSQNWTHFLAEKKFNFRLNSDFSISVINLKRCDFLIAFETQCALRAFCTFIEFEIVSSQRFLSVFFCVFDYFQFYVGYVNSMRKNIVYIEMVNLFLLLPVKTQFDLRLSAYAFLAEIQRCVTFVRSEVFIVDAIVF